MSFGLSKLTFRTHFVEYLVSVIHQANIDPLPILDLTDCVQELRRRGIDLPDRGPWDTDPIYREMCQKVMLHLIESKVYLGSFIKVQVFANLFKTSKDK